MPRPLNSQQRAFCAAYCKTRNQREAAISAGYSANTAAVIACNLMKKPLIAAEIARLTTRAQKKSELSAQLVMDSLARIVEGNLQDLHDPETGEMLPIHKMPRDVAAIIGKLELGNDGKVKKVSTHSKIAALELASKLLGMLRQEQNTQQAIQIILQAPTPQPEVPAVDASKLVPCWDE